MFGKPREERNDKISCVLPPELRGNPDPARTYRTWNGPHVVENRFDRSAILARFSNTCKCNKIQRIRTQFYTFNRLARLKFITFTGITESYQYY